MTTFSDSSESGAAKSEMEVRFPYFGGKNPRNWVQRLNLVFQANSTPEVYKLSIACDFLHDESRERFFSAWETQGPFCWDDLSDFVIGLYGSGEKEIPDCGVSQDYEFSEVWVAPEYEEVIKVQPENCDEQVDEIDELQRQMEKGDLSLTSSLSSSVSDMPKSVWIPYSGEDFEVQEFEILEDVCPAAISGDEFEAAVTGNLDEPPVKDLRLQLPGKETALNSTKNSKSMNSFNSSGSLNSDYSFVIDECPVSLLEVLDKDSDEKVFDEFDNLDVLSSDVNGALVSDVSSVETSKSVQCFDPGIVEEFYEILCTINGWGEHSLYVKMDTGGNKACVEMKLKDPVYNMKDRAARSNRNMNDLSQMDTMVRGEENVEYVRCYDPGIHEMLCRGSSRVEFLNSSLVGKRIHNKENRITEPIGCFDFGESDKELMTDNLESIMCFDPGIFRWDCAEVGIGDSEGIFLCNFGGLWAVVLFGTAKMVSKSLMLVLGFHILLMLKVTKSWLIAWWARVEMGFRRIATISQFVLAKFEDSVRSRKQILRRQDKCWIFRGGTNILHISRWPFFYGHIRMQQRIRQELVEKLNFSGRGLTESKGSARQFTEVMMSSKRSAFRRDSPSNGNHLTQPALDFILYDKQDFDEVFQKDLGVVFCAEIKWRCLILDSHPSFYSNVFCSHVEKVLRFQDALLNNYHRNESVIGFVVERAEQKVLEMYSGFRGTILTQIKRNIILGEVVSIQGSLQFGECMLAKSRGIIQNSFKCDKQDHGDKDMILQLFGNLGDQVPSNVCNLFFKLPNRKLVSEELNYEQLRKYFEWVVKTFRQLGPMNWSYPIFFLHDWNIVFQVGELNMFQQDDQTIVWIMAWKWPEVEYSSWSLISGNNHGVHGSIKHSSMAGGLKATEDTGEKRKRQLKLVKKEIEQEQGFIGGIGALDEQIYVQGAIFNKKMIFGDNVILAPNIKHLEMYDGYSQGCRLILQLLIGSKSQLRCAVLYGKGQMDFCAYKLKNRLLIEFEHFCYKMEVCKRSVIHLPKSSCGILSSLNFTAENAATLCSSLRTSLKLTGRVCHDPNIFVRAEWSFTPKEWTHKNAAGLTSPNRINLLRPNLKPLPLAFIFLASSRDQLSDSGVF